MFLFTFALILGLFLLVDVEVPAEVGLDGFVQDVNDIGAAHSHMVLEAILADILHQLLQVVHLCDGNTSVHAVWVVGQLSLTQIGLDTALRVVGRDAEEGERTFADLGIYGSKGVDLTQCTPQHAEGPSFRSSLPTNDLA